MKPLLLLLLVLGVPALADFTDETAAKLEPTRVVVYKKVGDRELHLNIFEPSGLKPGDKRLCFLSIHGGGWSGLSPRRQYPAAAHFAARGMVGICIEYRLFKKGSGNTVFDCVKDARSSVRYVRAHAAELGIDPQKIIVNGGSAGGHLAAGTALFDGVDEASDDTSVLCAPNALVLFFPVIDTSKEGYGMAKIGERWQELSPLHRVKAGVAPTIIFHGTGDTVTPFKGAKGFHDAMLKAGNRCELVPTEDAAHGYLMRDRALFEEALRKTEAFLASLGFMGNDNKWERQAAEDAKQDRTTIIFDGQTPNKLACDTTLRELSDGSWVMVMLGGGDREPLPQNQVFITRSMDKGKTWMAMTPLDLHIQREGNTAALVPSELMVRGQRCTLFFASHDGKFGGWKEWFAHSDDGCRTWSQPRPAPGRLRERTFIRNHIVARDGRLIVPFQHYLDAPGPRNPRNGVIISADGGKTWTEHGNIRLTADNRYSGWAENNIVELTDGRIAMIIRADKLGGVLYYAESKDGGRMWPEFARKTDIPNPGSKATLYPLGGDTVALLHNPNPKHRSPLALWISFDGLKTWSYQRVLIPESCDGPKGRLNYPDGFVSKDKQWFHFAFDDNRHRAVYYGAKLPPLPRPDVGTGDIPKQSGFAMDGYFVWCGSCIKVGDTYHLFASRWPVDTKFPDGYRQHSEIVRATASRPEGPYTFQELVIGARAAGKWDSGMAHNPAIYKAGDTFVLYYIGSDVGSRYRQIGIATAPAVTGPWMRRDQPLDLGLATDANNPAAYFEPDGSVKLIWRTVDLRVCISTAKSFEGPYTLANSNVWPKARLEDFFLFKQAGKYHLVCEDAGASVTGQKKWGAHLYSADGIRDWQPWVKPIAYDHTIRWTDGTTLTATRRERPWLLIEGGRITHLFTSVYDGQRTWNQPVPFTLDAVADAVEMAHTELWRRFVDKHNVILDYTDLDGRIIQPTPQDCREHKPNALSWGVPIEDGPMFNGLYLDAMCNRWKLTRDEADRAKARRLVDGLLFLSSLGNTPGFIARGVATDDKTTYPMGSNDQTTPWLYGLWRYMREGLAEQTERTRLIAKFCEVVTVLDANGWRMPCDGVPSKYRGGFDKPTWESAPRLLFVMKAMHEFTGDARWQQRYLDAANEQVGKGQRSRLEICRTGMVFSSNQGHRHSWTGSEGVICLRALWEMETDTKLRDAYAQGLRASAELAAQSLPLCREFNVNGTERFEHDWRVMNAVWKPQHSEAETVEVAHAGLRVQGKASPRMVLEKNLVREPCFAAWVVTLCPDASLVAQHRDAILEVITHYRCDRLYLSQFFPIESAWYRLMH